MRGEVQSLVGRFLQHLEKVRIEEGKGKQEAVRVEEIIAMTRAAKETAAIQTLGLNLRECLESRTSIIQENGVVG